VFVEIKMLDVAS